MVFKKLLPLKIPSGWAVIHNSFGDEDPIVQEGVIVNDEFYNEDLLSIEPLSFKETNWIVETTGYLIDLGWYPEADPEGNFKLVLLKDDWDNIVASIESSDRYVIHAAIEKMFDLITSGVGEDQLRAVLSEAFPNTKGINDSE